MTLDTRIGMQLCVSEICKKLGMSRSVFENCRQLAVFFRTVLVKIAFPEFGAWSSLFYFFCPWLELMWTRTELARDSKAVVLCTLSLVVKLAQEIPAPNRTSLPVSLFPGRVLCRNEKYLIQFSKKHYRKLPITFLFQGRLLLVNSVALWMVMLEWLKEWGTLWWEQGMGIQLFLPTSV